MVFTDPELNTYLEARIAYWTTRLMATRLFAAADEDDIRAEFRLVLLQGQPRFDAEKASARTYYAHLLDITAHRLYRQQQGEKAYRSACTLEDIAEPPAGLDGAPWPHDAERFPAQQVTAAVDARLSWEQFTACLPGDLRAVVQLLLRGEDRDTICRVLAISPATLTRKCSRLRATLGTPDLQPHPTRMREAPQTRFMTSPKGDSMATPLLTTYTQWQTFRNCRRACHWRYVRELVPRSGAPAQHLGTLVHDALMHWHQHRDLEAMLARIDQACAGRAADDDQRQRWHLARAMMQGYAQCYAEEAFRVVALETPFEMPIRNPATGRISRRFRLAGKVDGIVEEHGQYFLLEHKTASHLDGDYLERLWLDLQISLYSRALETIHGVPIAGVIYNVLCKAQLKQGKGETEAEFLLRKAELLAKNKSGKTSATRKEAESDAAFQARLTAKYADPAMFHREVILFTPEQYAELEAELWELTVQYLDALRRGAFYRNTSQCFAFGRPCPYYPLCRAGGAEHVIDALYDTRPPHEELRDAATEVNAPVF